MLIHIFVETLMLCVCVCVCVCMCVCMCVCLTFIFICFTLVILTDGSCANPDMCCSGMNSSCHRLNCFCDDARLRLKDCCPDFKSTCLTGIQKHSEMTVIRLCSPLYYMIHVLYCDQGLFKKKQKYAAHIKKPY